MVVFFQIACCLPSIQLLVPGCIEELQLKAKGWHGAVEGTAEAKPPGAPRLRGPRSWLFAQNGIWIEYDSYELEINYDYLKANNSFIVLI